jgi:hypothetical protein
VRIVCFFVQLPLRVCGRELVSLLVQICKTSSCHWITLHLSKSGEHDSEIVVNNKSGHAVQLELVHRNCSCITVQGVPATVENGSTHIFSVRSIIGSESRTNHVALSAAFGNGVVKSILITQPLEVRPAVECMTRAVKFHSTSSGDLVSDSVIVRTYSRDKAISQVDDGFLRPCLLDLQPDLLMDAEYQNITSVINEIRSCTWSVRFRIKKENRDRAWLASDRIAYICAKYQNAVCSVPIQLTRPDL